PGAALHRQGHPQRRPARLSASVPRGFLGPVAPGDLLRRLPHPGAGRALRDAAPFPSRRTAMSRTRDTRLPKGGTQKARTQEAGPPNGRSTKGRDAHRGAKAADRAVVKVRMYRQGLGDCFLLSFPTPSKDRRFFMMIDCGVILGTQDPEPKMRAVLEDIEATT